MLEPLRATDPRSVGDYRLVARLPAGGMADVFLGQEPRGEIFAVKVAKADPSGVLAEQFAQEMRTARRAHGRYIADVVGMGPHASPPWLATQYVPGPSLRDVVRAHGPLPAASVHALAAGLCAALASIHASNVMHGDLTPGNVLLVADGPRLIDFGISGMIEATTTLELDKPVFGTPGYVAPERLGLAGGRPTAASDVYSLGAVLWFALSGGPPDGGAVGGLAGGPALAGVPEPLRTVIARCQSPDPAARPAPAELLRILLPDGAMVASMFTGDWLPARVRQDIAARGAELDRLVASLRAGYPARPVPDREPAPRLPPPPPPPPPPVRRRSAVTALGVTAAVLVIGALVTWILTSRVDGEPGGRPSATATASPVGTDESPCRLETRPPPLDQLPYRCPIVWDARGATLDRVPVFRTSDVADPGDANRVGELVRGAAQYFTCHVHGARFHFAAQAGLPAANHDWWAYTQADNDVWGYVPEVYLLGGDDFVPDGGLRQCTAQDTVRAGSR